MTTTATAAAKTKWSRAETGDYVATVNGHALRVSRTRSGWHPYMDGKIVMGIRETCGDAKDMCEAWAEIS